MAADSQDDLNSALLAHQEGRLDEAEKVYRKISEEMPENADVWHLWGALSEQIGNITDAEQFLDRALELNPEFPEALNTRGLFYKNVGRLVEAETDFKKAIEYFPTFPHALTNLAETKRLQGHLEEAKRLNLEAISHAPDLAAAHNNLGAVERDLSNLEDALSSFQKALTLDGGLIDAEINLAGTLNITGKTEEALRHAKKAVQNAPDYAPAQNCLGLIYFDTENIADAQTNFEAACELDPGNTDALNNLANCLTRLNALDEALQFYDRALKINPKNPDFWANKAAALQAQNKIDQALGACEHALKVDANHADALWNRGMARLISGDLENGFADYENRWKLPEFKMRVFSQPQWQKGESLEGKTLLLHSEQGYGDTIQFIRYASLVSAEKPKAIYLETHKPLERLMETAADIDQVIVRGEELPAFDVHLPIMSLPFLLGTAGDTIPGDTPYLEAPEIHALNIEDRTKTSVGIVWAGRPTHKNDTNRTLSVETILPLCDLPNTQFYSLQVGVGSKDICDIPNIIDLSSNLVDFAATAAIINQLDIIISVDTAVAHLAGALNKECWVLLPYAPDWRWLLDRNDSPWYPSLTLLRQSRPGDWENVVKEIVQKLAART